MRHLNNIILAATLWVGITSAVLAQREQASKQAERGRIGPNNKLGAADNRTAEVRQSAANAGEQARPEVSTAKSSTRNTTKLANTTRLANTTKLANSTRLANTTGDQMTGSSLLRPSFFRGLLAGAARPRPEKSEEEEEEVTKTIFVPIEQHKTGEQSAKASGGQLSGASELHRFGHTDQGPPLTLVASSKRQVHSPDFNVQLEQSGHFEPQEERHLSQLQQHLKAQHQEQQQQQHLDAQASLRLSQTELSGLLSDREAPELYRQREQTGQGVMVSEEPQGRLGTSASDHLGTGSFGGAGGDFESMNGLGEQQLYRHRATAASEDVLGGEGGPAGFESRFGELAPMSQMGEPGQGRLAPSANDYSEAMSPQQMSGHGGAVDAEEYAHSLGAGGTEFSGQAGLLRAGSEFAGLGSFGAHEGGAFGGGGGAAGYGAGSPVQQDEYVSRFGAAAGEGGPKAHQQGVYGPGALDEAARFGAASGAHQMPLAPPPRPSRPHRLLPLSPLVPLADDQAARASQQHQRHQEALDASHAHWSGERGGATGARPQVHEPLEEDPTDLGEGGEQAESEAAGLVQQHQFQPMGATAQSQLGRRQQAAQDALSLVLNVPPPSGGQSSGEEHSARFDEDEPEQEEAARPQSQPAKRQEAPSGPMSPLLSYDESTAASKREQALRMVEFARVGSAGYLAPNLQPGRRGRTLDKKSGPHWEPVGLSSRARHQPQSSALETGGEVESEPETETETEAGQRRGASTRSSSASSELLENPAHAGKFIIS